MASVDAVDFAIYRYLSPDGAARFWGSRRVYDPRIGAREIAARIGLSETGVRARLRSLRERGYRRDSVVWPNPGLFDVSLHVAEIPVSEVGASRTLLRDLSLADGVTFARDVLDEEDRKLQVYFVGEGPSEIQRRAALIRRLAGARDVRGPHPYFVPEPSARLSSLDWKIVAGLRAAPEESLQQLGRRLGLSLKTTSRRYRTLIDSRAVWWSQGPTSAELPLALLTVGVDAEVDAEQVAVRVAEETDAWMPVAADGRGISPSSRAVDFAGLLLADSPAGVESIGQSLLDRAGVTTVRRTFALGSAIYPGWFDAQIARRQR